MMKFSILKNKLSDFRYEILLGALVLLIFDKIFFLNNVIYLQYVWPFNMVVVTIACFGIFNERGCKLYLIRNIMCAVSICMPFLFMIFNKDSFFVYFLTLFYIGFYGFIFFEVMKQITSFKEVQLNVVIGAFCGYMLLSMMALFAFILIELILPNSFSNIGKNLPTNYNILSYFSFITLTSIGFGDVHPINDSSRLLVAFFGMLGQFYMVAVVGIIISRFTAKTNN